MKCHIEKKLLWRAKFFGRFLQMVPFVRLVAICNNLSFGVVNEKSDIDFFIVASRGRLFTVRILITVILHVLGVRRHGKKVSGRICLSFFIDDSVSDLSFLSLNNDIYLKMWINCLIPLIDDDYFNVFLKANEWAFDSDVFPDDVFKLRMPVFFPFSLIRKILKFVLNMRLGNFVEKKLRSWQLNRISLKLPVSFSDKAVVANRHVLKFHLNDRRKLYNALWIEKYGKNARLSRKRFISVIS